MCLQFMQNMTCAALADVLPDNICTLDFTSQARIRHIMSLITNVCKADNDDMQLPSRTHSDFISSSEFLKQDRFAPSALTCPSVEPYMTSSSAPVNADTLSDIQSLLCRIEVALQGRCSEPQCPSVDTLNCSTASSLDEFQLPLHALQIVLASHIETLLNRQLAAVDPGVGQFDRHTSAAQLEYNVTRFTGHDVPPQPCHTHLELPDRLQVCSGKLSGNAVFGYDDDGSNSSSSCRLNMTKPSFWSLQTTSSYPEPDTYCISRGSCSTKPDLSPPQHSQPRSMSPPHNSGFADGWQKVEIMPSDCIFSHCTKVPGLDLVSDTSPDTSPAGSEFRTNIFSHDRDFQAQQSVFGACRQSHESDEEWSLRCAFLEAHCDRFPRTRLLSLASCFVNAELYGREYSPHIMSLLAELRAGMKELATRRRRREEPSSVGIDSLSVEKPSKVLCVGRDSKDLSRVADACFSTVQNATALQHSADSPDVFESWEDLKCAQISAGLEPKSPLISSASAVENPVGLEAPLFDIGDETPTYSENILRRGVLKNEPEDEQVDDSLEETKPKHEDKHFPGESRANSDQKFTTLVHESSVPSNFSATGINNPGHVVPSSNVATSPETKSCSKIFTPADFVVFEMYRPGTQTLLKQKPSTMLKRSARLNGVKLNYQSVHLSTVYHCQWLVGKQIFGETTSDQQKDAKNEAAQVCLNKCCYKIIDKRKYITPSDVTVTCSYDVV